MNVDNGAKASFAENDLSEQEEKKPLAYVPLHVHTEFSLLDGALKIKEYLKFAKEQGWSHAAITDHGNVFGAVRFFQEAKNFGIKPILGCELYTIPKLGNNSSEDRYFHLTCLVQNAEGYKNLCRIMEFAYREGFYFKPRVDYERLEEFSNGLIVGSGCLGGQLSRLLRSGQIQEADELIAWFLKVFGPDRYFFEVMPANDEPDQILHNKLIIEKALQFGVKIVATPDSHYLKADHKQAHEVLLCIGTKDLLSNPDRYTFGAGKFHLKSTDEMAAAFPENPEYITNSSFFAEQCNFSFEFGKLKFPTFVVPEGHTEASYFRELSQQGLENLFAKGLIPESEREVYQARLNLEMDMIEKVGFVGYFLVVGDFIAWSKKNGVPVGPGRGSAAGVLVAWALQITNIDPIKYNLLFERFLNPERVSWPDIDIDFCINGRERVINYVKEKYGLDSVCQIITFGTMMAKGVLKDVARVLGVPFRDSNSITDLVPNQPKMTLEHALELEPKLKNLVQTNGQVSQLFSIARVLEGITRHASKHAAGIVISPEPLKNVLPLFVPEKTSDLVTQYQMGDLEALGYLKMDFLGLKNLTVIDITLDSVFRRKGIKIDLDLIPIDDPKTFVHLSEGKTAGIFQFEGGGVTEIMCRLKPERFEDLIALNALYRPGPLGSGMVDDFIAGRHGTKKPEYMFPELEPVLAETYGVVVYQEQVMKIASVIGGYSLGGADLLRRAMGKKKPEEMAKQKSVFLKGACERGFDQAKAERLFELLAYFAGYGFNKSHSAAYALISYHTAYLKTHFPADFEAAILTLETSDPDKLKEYLQKTREAGVRVLPPDINRSQSEFIAIDEHTVLFGLEGIKNVGGAAIEQILAARGNTPFSDMLDLCRRLCGGRSVTKRVYESLIKSGATDGLPGTRAQKLTELERILEIAQEEREAALRGQRSLFSASRVEKGPSVYNFQSNLDFDLGQKLEFEREVVGFYLSSHPLDQFQNFSSWVGVTSFAKKVAEQNSDLADFNGFESDSDLNQASSIAKVEKGLTPEAAIEPNAPVVLVAILDSVRTVMTKKGQKMAILTFVDQKNRYECVAFPQMLSKIENSIFAGKPYFVQTNYDEQNGDTVRLKLAGLSTLEQFFRESFADKKFEIELFGNFAEQVKLLKGCAADAGFSVLLVYSENGRNVRVTPKSRFSFSHEILQQIETLGAKIKISVVWPKRASNFGQ